MKVVVAPWAFDGEKIKRHFAVAYQKGQIEAVGEADTLLAAYPDAPVERLNKNALLLPGLINAHVHLEFGANTTHLRYGDFMLWLHSVMANREELIENCRVGCYRRQIEGMLQSGITAFGAVSSYGKDLTACRTAPQRVVYFNEIIGSRPEAVDALYADFTARFEESLRYESDRFIPAVAVHSPYSVHPILMKKVLQNTPKRPLSAHFMESPAEAAWLKSGEGAFKPFFQTFLGQNAPLQSPESFLENLDRPALLTHVVQADDTLLERIAQKKHTVIHCPRSNRLLGCGRLALNRLKSRQIPWLLGTDGLSSNRSLNLWEEMRAALAMHVDAPLEPLASDLLKAVTAEAGRALGLPIGKLAAAHKADMIVVELPDAPEEAESLPLQAVLHTDKAAAVYIEGERLV